MDNSNLKNITHHIAHYRGGFIYFMESTLKFFQVPNDFFWGKNDPRGVTPVGIRLYCLLDEHRQYYNRQTVTSIDILSTFINVQSRTDRNKAKINATLIELRDKGYIYINPSVGNIRYNSTLTITKPEKIEHGFTQVDVVYYKDLTDLDEFALMCVMLKNKDLKRQQVSLDELAISIQCERKKAARVAERLCEKRLILISDNGWYSTPDGLVRKHTKSFRVKPEYKAERNVTTYDEPVEDVLIVSNPQQTFNKSETVIVAKETITTKQDFSKGRWVIDDEFPQYEDYKLFRENEGKDKKFDKRVKKRLEGIRKYKSALIQDWETEYEQELYRREEEERRQKISNITIDSKTVAVQLSTGIIVPFTPESVLSDVKTIFVYGKKWDDFLDDWIYDVLEFDVTNAELFNVVKAVTFAQDNCGQVESSNIIKLLYGEQKAQYEAHQNAYDDIDDYWKQVQEQVVKQRKRRHKKDISDLVS